MVNTTLPETFQHPSGDPERRLRRPVSRHFEAFYRAELRYCPTARLRTMDVGARYATWAAANGAPTLPQRQLVQNMAAVGHPRFKSNGNWFGSVAFATDRLDIEDNFPGPAIGGEDFSDYSPKLAALAMLDRAMASLHAARVRIEGM